MTPEELTELYRSIDALIPPLEPEEGDYAEECPEYPGIVFIKRANGTPLMMMSHSVWLELRKDVKENGTGDDGPSALSVLASDEEIRAAFNDTRCQTSDGKHTFEPGVFGGSCTVCGRTYADLA